MVCYVFLCFREEEGGLDTDRQLDGWMDLGLFVCFVGLLCYAIAILDRQTGWGRREGGIHGPGPPCMGW